jgi:hypothetical protein
VPLASDNVITALSIANCWAEIGFGGRVIHIQEKKTYCCAILKSC